MSVRACVCVQGKHLLDRNQTPRLPQEMAVGLKKVPSIKRRLEDNDDAVIGACEAPATALGSSPHHFQAAASLSSYPEASAAGVPGGRFEPPSLALCSRVKVSPVRARNQPQLLQQQQQQQLLDLGRQQANSFSGAFPHHPSRFSKSKQDLELELMASNDKMSSFVAQRQQQVSQQKSFNDKMSYALAQQQQQSPQMPSLSSCRGAAAEVPAAATPFNPFSSPGPSCAPDWAINLPPLKLPSNANNASGLQSHPLKSPFNSPFNTPMHSLGPGVCNDFFSSNLSLQNLTGPTSPMSQQDSSSMVMNAAGSFSRATSGSLNAALDALHVRSPISSPRGGSAARGASRRLGSGSRGSSFKSSKTDSTDAAAAASNAAGDAVFVYGTGGNMSNDSSEGSTSGGATNSSVIPMQAMPPVSVGSSPASDWGPMLKGQQQQHGTNVASPIPPPAIEQQWPMALNRGNSMEVTSLDWVLSKSTPTKSNAAQQQQQQALQQQILAGGMTSSGNMSMESDTTMLDSFALPGGSTSDPPTALAGMPAVVVNSHLRCNQASEPALGRSSTATLSPYLSGDLNPSDELLDRLRPFLDEHSCDGDLSPSSMALKDLDHFLDMDMWGGGSCEL